MIDILLVFPPYTYTRKNPPLGLAYIASVLEKGGYSVKILDMSAVGADYTVLEKIVRDNRPRIVGASFMTNQFHEAIKVTKTVKHIDPAISTVVGGPHVSVLPVETFSNVSVDFVVIGEGENTMLELAENIFTGVNKFEDIAGLAYRKETGEVGVTRPREYIEDLDHIPFPAWHLLPVEKYSVLTSGGDITKRVLPILSSRGCPNQCIFCGSHTVFGRRFRSRSAQNIIAEIVYLKNTYGVTQFDFVDDTITVDRKRTVSLCNLIMEKDLEISWMCNARVNTLDMDTLKLMKRAGCVRVDLGVESCDEKVLRAIKKGITLEQIRTAHKLVQQTGLQSNSFIMVGNIGEDFDSVKKTVRTARDFIEDANIAISTPFPGTELYEIAERNGWIQEKDWSRYVTSPTYLPGYSPVMVTDKMNRDEIMRAFFYVHSRFAKRKFETRYGKWYYVNPYFYSDKLFKIGSWREFVYKLKLIWRVVFQAFRR